MDDDKPGWKRFQKMSFDGKVFAKRAKKAETATVRHARKFITRRLDNLQDVRRHIALWLAGLALLTLSVGLQLVWLQSSYMTDAPVAGGTYAEAELGPVKTLNPLYASTSAERSAASLIFSSLLNYDTTGHLKPDLAESVTVDAKNTVYTVTLRSGIKWHDGSSLTADDVVFTVGLLKDPAARTSLRAQWQGIQATAVDARTVRFTLASPYAPFPHALTFAVLPKHVLESVPPESLRENAFSLQPVGSGPFVLKLVQGDGENKIVNLTRFDDYFAGAPKLSRFEIHAYANEKSIVNALKTHQVTAAVDVSDASAVQNVPGYNLHRYPVNSGVYALFNTSQSPLKDSSVRRALQEGLDIKKLRQMIGKEYQALDLPFIPGQLEGEGLPTVPAYDAAQAGKLLDKAGWKLVNGVRQKKGVPLTIRVVTVKDTQFQKAVDAMKESWEKLGVKVEKMVVDPDDPSSNFVQTILQPRAYDVLVYELTIGADPDVYAFWHSSQIGPSGLNLSSYDNGVADDTLSSARVQQSAALRGIKYKTFAKQWVSDVPAIGLYQSNLLYVQNTQARTLTKTQKLVSPFDRYANVTDWTTDHASVYKTP